MTAFLCECQPILFLDGEKRNILTDEWLCSLCKHNSLLLLTAGNRKGDAQTT